MGHGYFPASIGYLILERDYARVSYARVRAKSIIQDKGDKVAYRTRVFHGFG